MKDEFNEICKDILFNKDFLKLKKIGHHEGNRFNHSFDVAYNTYKITKKHNLNYKEATRAALLHDFFLEDFADVCNWNLICNHGKIAKKNALKYYNLTPKQQNIIESHMFPLGFVLPKSKEAWLISGIDKYCATKEFFTNFRYSHVISIISLILILKKIF